MLRLTCEDSVNSGVVSRWLRDAPSGTGCADGIGVRHANQAPIVLALFILTQVLDGALTYWGVSQFGLGVESNAWLASLMHAIGAAPALIAAKVLAVACGYVLFATTSFRVLAVATGWCLGFAVVPWLALFTAFGNLS
jgi:uncharacterized membrane protein